MRSEADGAMVRDWRCGRVAVARSAGDVLRNA